MNKLDKEVVRVCDKLTEKPGRGVILLVVEPDGVHENGVIYGYHAVSSGRNMLVRSLIQVLSSSFLRMIHLMLGKGGER